MIFRTLPRELAEWASRHVRGAFSESVRRATVTLTPDGYYLKINPDYWATLTSQASSALVMHLLSHALRGDCLVAAELPAETRRWYNVAADAAINPLLDKAGAADLDKVEPLVYWERIRLEEWPVDFPGTKAAWRWLCSVDDGPQRMQGDADPENDRDDMSEVAAPIHPRGSLLPREQTDDTNGDEPTDGRKGLLLRRRSGEDQDHQGPSGPNRAAHGGKDGYAGLCDDIAGCVGDFRGCQTAHARTLLSASPAVRGRVGDGKLNVRRPLRRVDVPPIVRPAIVRRVEAMLRRVHNVKTRQEVEVVVRTWTRQHRSSPALPGRQRQRRHLVTLAIDVSGSVTDYLPDIVAVARGFRRDLNCRIIAWAGSAAEVSDPRHLPKINRGTRSIPMLKAVCRTNPALTLVITDARFGDKPTVEMLPRTPVWWLLVGRGSAKGLPLRGNDRVWREVI